MTKQYILKLVVLGDAAVGKTSLINQYIDHSFKEDYKPTLGVNILTKDLYIEKFNLTTRLILWDLAAQEKYALSRALFFQGCSGALFVFDLTRHLTFTNISSIWYEDFLKFANNTSGSNYLLIGNKSDLKESRTVKFEEGETLSNQLKSIEYIETSAKYGANVEEAFKKLVFHIIKKKYKEV
ncbi:MAG: Rab family GTPase [Promethearchaeota archaeon]